MMNSLQTFNRLKNYYNNITVTYELINDDDDGDDDDKIFVLYKCFMGQ